MASSSASTAAARGGSVSRAVSVISTMSRVGRDAELVQHADDLVGEARPAEGAGRHVDRHRHVPRSRTSVERRAQDPRRQLVDEVGLLAQGMNRSG